MQPALTKDDIERASRREGPVHPVVSILEYHEPEIVGMNKEYAVISDSHARQVYLSGNFGFFGDAFEKAGDFSLAPLDLVAIWSKAMELWPMSFYPRYRLSAMLASSYGIIGRSDLKGLSRHYIETSTLTERLAGDKSALLHVSDRLDAIGQSFRELDFYICGVPEYSSIRLARELAIKIMAGDEEASRRLDELERRHREYMTPLLDQLLENQAERIAFQMSVKIALDKAEL